jgi:hypothetical protein
MGLNLRFTHLTSTATPFKHMKFSRNGNKRSSIEIKYKGIGHQMVIHLKQMYRSEIIELRSLKIFFENQEWLNVISTLVFGVLMKKK